MGSPTAYTVLAGLFAATVYPYVAVGGGGDEKKIGDVGWLAFRHAIPRWGQYWHRSCGRVYEEEGPESWVRRREIPADVEAWGAVFEFCRQNINSRSRMQGLWEMSALFLGSKCHIRGVRVKPIHLK